MGTFAGLPIPTRPRFKQLQLDHKSAIFHRALVETANAPLEGCSNLQELPDSINDLTSLQHLTLMRCGSLVALPKFITHHVCDAYPYEATYKNSPHSYTAIGQYIEGRWTFKPSPNLRQAIEINHYYADGTSTLFEGRVNNCISSTCLVLADIGTPPTNAMLRHLGLPLTSSLLWNKDEVERMIIEEQRVPRPNYFTIMWLYKLKDICVQV